MSLRGPRRRLPLGTWAPGSRGSATQGPCAPGACVGLPSSLLMTFTPERLMPRVRDQHVARIGAQRVSRVGSQSTAWRRDEMPWATSLLSLALCSIPEPNI